jgi:hypothetical protein
MEEFCIFTTQFEPSYGASHFPIMRLFLQQPLHVHFNNNSEIKFRTTEWSFLLQLIQDENSTLTISYKKLYMG